MKGSVNLKNEKIENKEKSVNEIQEVKQEDEPPDIGCSCHHRKIVLDIEAISATPFTGRIVLVGLLEINTQKFRVFFDRNEEVMLRRVIRCFDQENYHEIVGFNVSYDLRFLLGRVMKYKLSAASLFTPHCHDIMWTLKKVRNDIDTYNRPGSLHEWAVCILGEGKKEKTGSVSSLYHQNKITELIEYNKRDLWITFLLWRRINQALGYQDKQEAGNLSRFSLPKYLGKKQFEHNRRASDETVTIPAHMTPQSGIDTTGRYDE